MYFASPNTIIYSSTNIYENFIEIEKGGVYQLDMVVFEERFSKYMNNSAYQGGAISCTKCSMTTIGNTFQYNIAYEGGVIYLESDSIIISKQDKFISNSGLQYGGVLFATTNTNFNFYNGLFDSNFAFFDSAITALKTSTSKPFLIQSSTFTNNQANSNTISLK